MMILVLAQSIVLGICQLRQGRNKLSQATAAASNFSLFR